MAEYLLGEDMEILETLLTDLFGEDIDVTGIWLYF
jgi:hypothetical protein